MISDKKLNQFCELAVKIGVNLQEGQDLVIRSQIECAPIARTLAEVAYKNGARKVSIEYSDEKFSRIKIDNESIEALQEIPDWFVASRNYIMEKNAALISIAAGNPSIFKGCDAQKLQASSIATSKACKEFYDNMMQNAARWLVISVPTEDWAKKVFPNAKSGEEAVNLLWEAIAMTMRLNYDDPTLAWKEHISTLKRRSDFLNQHNFKSIRMTSKNGTDLNVGLADGHIWTAAEEKAKDGISFTANLPTEEIFTAPHKYHVDGVVKNALPLVDNGNIIDDFSITFKDGKVVDYSAKEGYDALKNIIETDEGSCRIGEIALIGKNSPIAQSKILFYNTLFDENASCHLALGKCYPTTIKGGEHMSKEELDKVGCNDSLEHCDFMVGTSDMTIEGITHDGKVVKLFEDGEWII